jgi:hypothetical protein
MLTNYGKLKPNDIIKFQGYKVRVDWIEKIEVEDEADIYTMRFKVSPCENEISNQYTNGQYKVCPYNKVEKIIE